MKHGINILFRYLFLVTLFACEGDVLPEPQDNLVVEGWIEDGNFPVVMLTRNVPLSGSYQDIDDLGKYLVRWAKVSVSDGTDTVVLTGMYQSNYYPPYIYTTGRMRGQAGKTYHLTVEYDDYYATASTTIPASVPLDSVVVVPSSDSDTLYQLNAYFNDNPTTKDYYILFTNVNRISRQSFISYMGYVDDALLAGSHVTIPVYRGRVLSDDNYNPFFSITDTVEVRLAHTDEATFNFWSDVQTSVSFSTNMFMPVMTNVRSNVEGGIGYWAGYGLSRRIVVVGDEVRGRGL